MKSIAKFLIAPILLLIILTSPAYANIGVPMIFITLPGMLLALMPIIAIESKVFCRYFSFNKFQIVKYTAITNSISTIIGIPFAWLIHTVLIILFAYAQSSLFPHANIFNQKGLSLFFQVTLGAAWLGPVENQLYWMIPAACIFLLLPNFFASCYIEYFIMKKLIKNFDSALIRSATFKANKISYSFLAIVAIIWLVTSILEKKLMFIA